MKINGVLKWMEDRANEGTDQNVMPEGRKGIVRDCKDLHNVHITFEGEGIMIDWYKTPFECGGSGLYCFAENCEDNCENEDPLYYYELPLFSFLTNNL